MERVNFGYSMKNIPIHDENSYKVQLIQKEEDFVKKIKWKAIFFMKEIKLNLPHTKLDSHLV